MKALLKDALFLGTMLAMLWLCGCDVKIAKTIYPEHENPAYRQAYEDGRKGIEYGK